MSIRVFCVCCLTMLIVVGCQPTVTSYGPPVLETQARTEEVAETQIVPPSEINPAIEPSPTTLSEIILNKITPANSSEARLSNQCLNITNVPPASNSIIALRSLVGVVPGQTPDIILIDMSEEQLKESTQKINITPNFAVSPDGELIVYLASTITNGVTQLNLIIANGNFQTINSIPWNDHWSRILGWTADQKIIVSSSRTETISPSFVSYTLIDPISGGQQSFHLGISDFIDGSLYDAPYWESWYGVLVDPTLKWAVYPKQSNVNAEMYTYALWDISNNKSVFDLEKIFSSFWFFINASPMPSWSSDGGQFAFVGQHQDESPGEIELFSVNVNGDILQLTNLSSIGYVLPSFHSWSPDNSLIAFSITPRGSDVGNIAIVNAVTLDVTDLCLSINVQEPPPIWSPNGKQFLVVDRYDEGHQRVLLVDIEKNIVFPVVADAEPIGWMVKP